MTDELHIPPKLVARLTPRRAAGPRLEAKSETDIVHELAAFEKSYAKNKYADKLKSTLMAKGCETKSSPELGAARRQACAILLALSLDGLRDASLDTLAIAEITFRWNNYKHRDQSLMGAIAHARGLAFAIDVQLRTLELELGADKGYTTAVHVTTSKRPTELNCMDDWEPLRVVVCRAADADYAAARKHAAGLRKALPPLVAAHVAFVFPDEPWAEDDLRACVTHAKQQPTPSDYADDFSTLLGCCRDAAVIREFLAVSGGHMNASAYALDWMCTLPRTAALELLRDALPEMLRKPKYGPLLKTPPRVVAEAIACCRTPEAAAVLAPYFGNAILGLIVAAYFKEAPELQSALEGQAKGKSKGAEAAARLLETAKSKAKRPEGPVAADAEIPGVLRDRPWRPRKRGAKPVVLDLALPSDVKERVELTEEERATKFDSHGSTIREMTEAELAKWRKEIEKGEFAYADFEFDYIGRSHVYMVVPEAEGLRAWNEGKAYVQGELAYLARHGVAAIPGFLARPWITWLNYTEVDEDRMGIMHRIVSPRLAPQMARVMMRRKRFRREAQAWLSKHAAVAAQGLLPDAFGKPGQGRDDAEQAVLYLAHKGDTSVLEAAARAHGPKVVAALGVLLARDPLAIDVAPPKPPDFLRLEDLPPVRTKSGARLPEDAVDALVEMLRVAPLDPPYPGVAAVREGLDGESLGALAREILEQWVLSGGNGRFEWMIFTASHLPSEQTTRRVTELARDWARRDRAKAQRACVTLAAIGTDLALLHLGHIAATSRFDDLRKEARGLLDEAAAARGLSRDELEDRIVPDLDLAADGTLRLSYGARAFVVSLDEGLRPVVKDEAGTTAGSLPRALKTDDAARAKAARERFDAFKRDAAHIADRQLRRLEGAMIAGREWSAADFTSRVATHPLLLPLVRRLVWEVELAGGAATELRVAEDGSFAGPRDEAVSLAVEARVRIAHPAQMMDEARAAWAAMFADYKLVQPFEQLGRAVFRPTTAERAAERIERAAGVKVAAKKVLGVLESRGWRRDDRAHVNAYLRDVRGAGLVVCIPITPGFSIEDLDGATEQTLGPIELRGAAARQKQGATFGSLDVIDFSEAVRDALALALGA